jgi:maleylacetate reductase
VIVRWTLNDLPAVLAELGIERPYLVAGPRWDSVLDLPVSGRLADLPADVIEPAPASDGLVAIGGGSAIDTAKAGSAATGLPLVSIPTTYSGAEWATSFGIRTRERRIVGGGGGARLGAIVYDVGLTLDLPRAETVGTALNALAHSAEALYTPRRTPESDARALEGARLIAK